MAEANDQLRAARERTASPTNPGSGLSRQELAEMVNAWVWKHRNKEVLATANYIGKLETGLIRWPRTWCREALRAILSAPTDAALGFINARSRHAAVKLDDVDRQNLIRGTAALGVGTLVLGPLAAALEGIEPPPTPTRVGATDIEQIRIAKQVFQSWSLTYGGRGALDAVMGELRWSAALLKATCPDELSPELHFAVGDLADTAGFIAMDAGADEQARRAFRLALYCAEKAKNWHLRADVLGYMTVHAIQTGQPDEGLTLAEHALVRADRLTEIERSILHTERACALAKMRRVQETLTAIGTADDHFSRATPANDPSPMSFMIYHNPAVHALRTGHALADLAILGHNPGEATDRLTTAAAGLTGYTRPLARCQIWLASLMMITGDPLQAVTIGHGALDAAGTIRSRTAADDLRELSRHAAAHQSLDEVAHLQHRITSLLVHTDSPQREGKSFPS
ncbi:MAG: XRE family transcriptional regulator [Pseudonocardiaceae bacterium]